MIQNDTFAKIPSTMSNETHASQFLSIYIEGFIINQQITREATGDSGTFESRI